MAVTNPLWNWKFYWRIARMGEGESPMVGMEMKERLKFRPRRKVVWTRLTSWRVSKEGMVEQILRTW
jgi:hypothetical protein